MAEAQEQPFRFATYNGDVTSIIGDVKGPGQNGKFWMATDAEYDPNTNKTRVEFDLWEPEVVTQ